LQEKAPNPAQWIDGSRLWLVLDRDAAAPRSLPEATQLCIEGGVDAVVFRMKNAEHREAIRLATDVREMCRKESTPFVLAHYAHLVHELAPDALHLGVEDRPLAEMNLLFGSRMAIGFSAHSVAEAARALAQGADYAFLGPIFDTPRKRLYGPPLGDQVICEAEQLPSPVVYIGGMNEQTIPLANAAGANRVAAISALLSVPDPRAAARRLKALLPPA
jgi:thiamine-phosphate pyrophosphorylase